MAGSHTPDSNAEALVTLASANGRGENEVSPPTSLATGAGQTGSSPRNAGPFREGETRQPRNRWQIPDVDTRQGLRLRSLASSFSSFKGLGDGSPRQVLDGMLRQPANGRLTAGSPRDSGAGLSLKGGRDEELRVSMTLYRKDMARLKEEKADVQLAYDALLHEFRELHRTHEDVLSQQDRSQSGHGSSADLQSDKLRLIELEASVQERDSRIGALECQLAAVPRLEGQVQILVHQLEEARESAEKGITDQELLEMYREQSTKVNELQSALKEVEEQREKHLAQVLLLEEQGRRVPYLEQQLQHHKVETAKLEARLKGCLEEAAGYKEAASKAAMEAEALKEHVEALEKCWGGVESVEMNGRIGSKLPSKGLQLSIRSSPASDVVLGRVYSNGKMTRLSTASPSRPLLGAIGTNELSYIPTLGSTVGPPPVGAQEYCQGVSGKVREWLESAAGEEAKWSSEKDGGARGARTENGPWGSSLEGEHVGSSHAEPQQGLGAEGERRGQVAAGDLLRRRSLFEDQEAADEEKREGGEDGDEGDEEMEEEEYNIVRQKLGEMRAMVEAVEWQTPRQKGGSPESEGEEDGNTEEDEGIILEELELVKEEVEWRKEEMRRLTEEVDLWRNESGALYQKLEAADRQLATLRECQVAAAENAKEAKAREDELAARLEQAGRERAEEERRWKQACSEWEEQDGELRTLLREAESKCGLAERELLRMLEDRNTRERQGDGDRRLAEERERQAEDEKAKLEEERNYLELRCRRAEKDAEERRVRWEEASRKVRSLEQEIDRLEGAVAAKDREVEEIQEEKQRVVKQEKERWGDLLDRMRKVEEERQQLEVQLQEGEMKSKVLEGGWNTLQERVRALQQEVVEERVRGLQLEEAKLQEEARFKEALAAQEALARLEDEKKRLQEKCRELEERVQEKEREVETRLQAHEKELCEERLRVRAVVKEIEAKRRGQVEVEITKARDMRSRENEILNEEIARLKGRLVDIETKQRKGTAPPARGR